MEGFMGAVSNFLIGPSFQHRAACLMPCEHAKIHMFVSTAFSAPAGHKKALHRGLQARFAMPIDPSALFSLPIDFAALGPYIPVNHSVANAASGHGKDAKRHGQNPSDPA